MWFLTVITMKLGGSVQTPTRPLRTVGDITAVLFGNLLQPLHQGVQHRFLLRLPITLFGHAQKQKDELSTCFLSTQEAEKARTINTADHIPNQGLMVDSTCDIIMQSRCALLLL